VRPVISLDVSYPRSEFKRTLYIASTLTGANNIFPIGFTIAAGNDEDQRTWVRMLTYLKDVSPIISQQGQGKGMNKAYPDIYQQGQGEGMNDALLPKTSTSIPAMHFLFVSDRDKVLKRQ
jgi:hypothetical protein